MRFKNQNNYLNILLNIIIITVKNIIIRILKNNKFINYFYNFNANSIKLFIIIHI